MSNWTCTRRDSVIRLQPSIEASRRNVLRRAATRADGFALASLYIEVTR